MRIVRVDLVTDSIAIGSFVEAGDAKLLASHGITAVLCLAKDRMKVKPPAGVEKDSRPLQRGHEPLVRARRLSLARRERLTLDQALARIAAKRPTQAVAPGLLDVLERTLATG